MQSMMRSGSILVWLMSMAAIAHARVPPGEIMVPATSQAPGLAARAQGGAVDPADPLYEQQWGLENSGQLGGLIDTDIDAEGAWTISEGSAEILVGVLDTGVDITHPDLARVLWVNQAEASGVPGIDDDDNGCIDDIHGCWFSQDCTRDTPECAPQPVGAHIDENGHGTAVAGIIAAAARNGEGGRGVAPGVRIVVLHVATPEGYFWDEPVYRALEYAAHVGVDVINISAYFDGPDLAYQDQALSIATDSGALIVASAGNWGVNIEAHQDDLPYLPDQSLNPAIMRIAAVDRYDRMISYAGWWGSSFGPGTVHVAAPSQAIATTYPVTNGADPYTYTFNGTSASAPFAAGVAALVLSVNPTLDALAVKSILEDTVDPVAGLAGMITSGGRVNAANAMRAAMGMGMPPVAVASGPIEVELGELASFSADGSMDPDGGAVTLRWHFDDGEVAEGADVGHVFGAEGIYHVTLEAEDQSGMRSAVRLTVTVPFVWRDAPMTFESEHPYQQGSRENIAIPGARLVRLHFERLELAVIDNDFVGDDDAVLVFDATGTPLWSRSNPGEDFWTDPLPVHGDNPLVLRFFGSSGNGGGAWGYRIDQVQYVGDEAFDDAAGCGCAVAARHQPPASMLFLALCIAMIAYRRIRGTARADRAGSCPATASCAPRHWDESGLRRSRPSR